MINKLLSRISTDNWAISENFLRTMAQDIKSGLAFAGHTDKPMDTKNFSEALGESVRLQKSNMPVSLTDGIATITIDTMILARNDMFTDYFGINTIESIVSAVNELDANDLVKHIILAIDSPGGTTTNVSEAVEAIRSATTPTTSYAYGSMASLSYWIGSSSDNIIASPTGQLGSIGTLVKMSKEDSETVTLISNLSPNKNAGPDTAEGQSQIMAILDGITAIFHKDIAESRGISQETVANDFGKGAMFIASDALERGMIDGIATSVGDLIKSIDENGKLNNISNNNQTNNNTEGHSMADTNNQTTPAPVAPVVEPIATVETPAVVEPTIDLVAAERNRIQSIEAISKTFSASPAHVRSAVDEIVSNEKFNAEASAESVNTAIVAALPGILAGVTADALESGRESVEVAESIPTAPESAEPKSETEIAEIKEEETANSLIAAYNNNQTKTK